MTAVVEMHQLAKAYQMPHGFLEVLKGINLTIHQGEQVALMGPSGSGKSTLLHVMGCLDVCTSGSYYLGGQNVALLSDHQLAAIRASHIGFVFQAFNLISHLTVWENVEVPFLYRPHLAGNQNDKILHSLERVGLAHRLHHLPSQLSGGESQRVAIARALAIDPLLILADEPTGNLDSLTGQTILSLFQELNQQGVTIVIITHDEIVGASCRRLIRLRDGYLFSDDRIMK